MMLRERKKPKVRASSKRRHRKPKSRSKRSTSWNIFVFVLFCFAVSFLLVVGYRSFSKFKRTRAQKALHNEAHDLLIIVSANGGIWTMDDNMPRCNAICVDVTTGKFIYISNNTMKLWYKCLQIPHKSAKWIDASRYMVLPGLIDTHAHIMMQGALQSNTTIDLSKAESFKKMNEMIKKYIKDNKIEKGSWIQGIGYDDTHWYDWYNKGDLSRFDIDEYTNEYKLVLHRIDLHALLINTNALNGIKDTFPTNIDTINGGKVMRNEEGELTGLFIDNAMTLVTQHIHPYYGDIHHKDGKKYSRSKQMLHEVIKECNKYGLTAVHDMNVQRDIIENVYKDSVDNDLDKFNLRLSVYVHGSSDRANNLKSDVLSPTDYNKYLMYKDRLSVSGVNLYLDGALGSRGAKLIAPYCDALETDGIWRYNKIDNYYNDMKRWHNHGWQIATNAVGDKANRVALNMYKKLIDEYNINDAAALRLRIEHAQIVEPNKDLPRFGSLSVIANMQPAHVASDMEFAEKRLNCRIGRKRKRKNRMLGAYAWKSMLQNGVKLTFGSDFPALNPLLGIYTASTRKSIGGWPGDGWFPKEKVSIMEALRAYTMDAAYASFQEDYIGSISPNKFADFILIDKRLFKFHGKGDSAQIKSLRAKKYPPNHPIHITQTKVVATFFGGEMVYHNESYAMKYLDI